jgi:hypothetical protein
MWHETADGLHTWAHCVRDLEDALDPVSWTRSERRIRCLTLVPFHDRSRWKIATSEFRGDVKAPASPPAV